MNERDSPAVLAYRVGTLEISVKEGMEGLNRKLDNLLTTFAQKDDLVALDKRVAKLEGKDSLKNTLLWVGLACSAIINIVGAAKVFGAL